MRTRIMSGVGFVLASWASWATTVAAQDVIWRPTAPLAPASAKITLGIPEPLTEPAPQAPAPTPTKSDLPRFVRMQAGDPPPPPPAFPGTPPPYSPGPVGGNPYYGGVVNSDADQGSFWTRCGEKIKRCWTDVTGSVSGNSNHKMFESDSAFPGFISPVTNPFYFEDPRSLTEFRPIFIWEHAPSNNPIYNHGNNYVISFSGSVAFTENISLVINRLGFNFVEPNSPTPVSSGGTFSDIMLGPKFTFIRNESTHTVAAAGLTFDIPAGSTSRLQDVGHLMLTPYFSIAQAFGQSSYGTFNFMNTTGYDFRTDNTRSESFFSSFHVDYDVGNYHRFFPLVELNWRYYTRNGGAHDFNFEGDNFSNFGSEHVSGLNDLNLAFGGRVVINKYVTWGLGLEFSLLNSSGGRHLDQFTLTTDFIFRY